MPIRVRHPVLLRQRHPVTDFRQTDGMTVGERIKSELRAKGKSVKWLAQVTGIPPSTLYDLIRGDITSTPRLPTIAAALGLNALWLESGKGPKYAHEGAAQQTQIAYGWPFSFSRDRWERLPAAQKKRIEEVVEGMILAFEAGSVPSQQKSQVRRLG